MHVCRTYLSYAVNSHSHLLCRCLTIRPSVAHYLHAARPTAREAVREIRKEELAYRKEDGVHVRCVCNLLERRSSWHPAPHELFFSVRFFFFLGETLPMVPCPDVRSALACQCLLQRVGVTRLVGRTTGGGGGGDGEGTGTPARSVPNETPRKRKARQAEQGWRTTEPTILAEAREQAPIASLVICMLTPRSYHTHSACSVAKQGGECHVWRLQAPLGQCVAVCGSPASQRGIGRWLRHRRSLEENRSGSVHRKSPQSHHSLVGLRGQDGWGEKVPLDPAAGMKPPDLEWAPLICFRCVPWSIGAVAAVGRGERAARKKARHLRDLSDSLQTLPADLRRRIVPPDRIDDVRVLTARTNLQAWRISSTPMSPLPRPPPRSMKKNPLPWITGCLSGSTLKNTSHLTLSSLAAGDGIEPPAAKTGRHGNTRTITAWRLC